MKLINDRHGHDEGDRAIRDCAQILASVFREADVIARLGGDEFVIFAYDVTPENLDSLRVRLRAATDSLNRTAQRPFRLSMSVGAAFFDTNEPETIAELLERADHAMYEQKRERQARGGKSLPPPTS